MPKLQKSKGSEKADDLATARQWSCLARRYEFVESLARFSSILRGTRVKLPPDLQQRNKLPGQGPNLIAVIGAS
jgi:hypothetical protein